jgi:hypothetical protein
MIKVDSTFQLRPLTSTGWTGQPKTKVVRNRAGVALGGAGQRLNWVNIRGRGGTLSCEKQGPPPHPLVETNLTPFGRD